MDQGPSRALRSGRPSEKILAAIKDVQRGVPVNIAMRHQGIAGNKVAANLQKEAAKGIPAMIAVLNKEPLPLIADQLGITRPLLQYTLRDEAVNTLLGAATTLPEIEAYSGFSHDVTLEIKAASIEPVKAALRNGEYPAAVADRHGIKDERVKALMLRGDEVNLRTVISG